MDLPGFLRRSVFISYDIWKERAAFIIRMTVMVEMDTEVMRKQMCLLLRAMKKSLWKI